MARTKAHILDTIHTAARERTRKRRQAMRVRRRPETTTVDYAIAEALAFLIAKAALSARTADEDVDPRSIKDGISIPLVEMRDVTLDILVRRKHYDRAEAKIALGQRLRIRTAHLEPAHIPSLRPDPDAQEARAAS